MRNNFLLRLEHCYSIYNVGFQSVCSLIFYYNLFCQQYLKKCSLVIRALESNVSKVFVNAGVFISCETLIFVPPPFFRIIFFSQIYNLKTDIFTGFLKPTHISKKFDAGERGLSPPCIENFCILAVSWSLLVPYRGQLQDPP